MRLRKKGGELSLVISSSHFLKLFEITGLVSVFQIHDTVDAAVGG